MANITDLTAQIQFRKLIYFGLDELFDYVVTSEEAGMDKPHKSAFELAIKKLNCRPEKIIMIGDDLIDFVNQKLFPYLKKFKLDSDSANTIQYKIGEIFSELKNRIQSGYNLREVLSRNLKRSKRTFNPFNNF